MTNEPAGLPFDPVIARLYTPGRVVRVVENKGCWTCGKKGSIGVVYATFKDESAPEVGLPFGGFAVLFEHGLVEGFSLEQASWWLMPTAVVHEPLANYRFDGLGTISKQYEEGFFDAAFDAGRRHLRIIPTGH